MRYFTSLLALSLLSSCATDGAVDGRPRYTDREQAELTKQLAGLTAGEPKRCLSVRNLGSPTSYGDNTLIFRLGRNLVYKNEARGTCRDVGKWRALVTRVYGSQVCAGDFAESVDLTTGGGSFGTCVLGNFVPYRRVKVG